MDFTIEANLGTYSEDALQSKIAEGTAALDALLALADPTEDDVSSAEGIAAALVALRTELSARAAAVVSRTERMAAVRSAQEAPTPEQEAPGEATETEPATEPEPVPASEPAAPTEAPARTGTRAAVAASIRRPVVPASTPALTILASADVPGFATGSAMDDLDAIGEGMIGRMRAFPPPAGIENGQMSRYPVAQLRRTFASELVTDGGASDMDVIMRAAKEDRLPGGSLTAAGGWCAPSETIYDLCAGETTDGIISLPEVQVRRGGIRYTKGPAFKDIYDNVGFWQTEAQAIAGTAKPCYEVTCPPFVEVRLDAVGICVKAPLLTNAAYPELTKRVLSGSLIAHQHKVSATLINKMVAAAGAAEDFGSVGSGASNVLDSVELAATALRESYRLAQNASLEVLAPTWIKAHIRADLANKAGVNNYNISDSDIAAYFAVRGVNVQFVYWQPLVAYTVYPGSVDLLVYPAGTFVKGVADVISLDAVYDAASLSTNTYTAAFVEEGVLLAQQCYEAKLLTVPLCAGGIAGDTNTECLTAVITP